MGSSVAGGGARGVFERVRNEARTAEGRDVIRALVRAYRDNDLLTYASAISFQVLFALIPLILFALGLLGFLSLQDVWAQDLAPDLQPNVSHAVFVVIDGTVRQVLTGNQLFWATFGAAIAVWEISGAVRAVMQVFNRIYDVPETRPFWRRIRISLVLAAAAGALLLIAATSALFAPPLIDSLTSGSGIVHLLASVIGWGIALALLVLLVGLLVHYAPNMSRPLNWVSFGALLVVGAWSVMTAGFSVYATQIADYGSIFGSLATVIVLMTYIYASAIVFLTGIQLDALVSGGFAEETHG
jgi:membrane protein